MRRRPFKRYTNHQQRIYIEAIMEWSHWHDFLNELNVHVNTTNNCSILVHKMVSTWLFQCNTVEDALNKYLNIHKFQPDASGIERRNDGPRQRPIDPNQLDNNCLVTYLIVYVLFLHWFLLTVRMNSQPDVDRHILLWPNAGWRPELKRPTSPNLQTHGFCWFSGM